MNVLPFSSPTVFFFRQKNQISLKIRENSQFVFLQQKSKGYILCFLFGIRIDWNSENVWNLATLICCVNLLTSGIVEEIAAKRTKVAKIISLKAQLNFKNFLRKLLIHYKLLLYLLNIYFTCWWTFNQIHRTKVHRNFWHGYFGRKILFKSVTIHLIAKTSKQIIFIWSKQNVKIWRRHKWKSILQKTTVPFDEFWKCGCDFGSAKEKCSVQIQFRRC